MRLASWGAYHRFAHQYPPACTIRRSANDDRQKNPAGSACGFPPDELGTTAEWAEDTGRWCGSQAIVLRHSSWTSSRRAFILPPQFASAQIRSKVNHRCSPGATATAAHWCGFLIAILISGPVGLRTRLKGRRITARQFQSHRCSPESLTRRCWFFQLSEV